MRRRIARRFGGASSTVLTSVSIFVSTFSAIQARLSRGQPSRCWRLLHTQKARAGSPTLLPFAARPIRQRGQHGCRRPRLMKAQVSEARSLARRRLTRPDSGGCVGHQCARRVPDRRTRKTIVRAPGMRLHDAPIAAVLVSTPPRWLTRSQLPDVELALPSTGRPRHRNAKRARLWRTVGLAQSLKWSPAFARAGIRAWPRCWERAPAFGLRERRARCRRSFANVCRAAHDPGGLSRAV